jgi:hypothetical protein
VTDEHGAQVAVPAAGPPPADLFVEEPGQQAPVYPAGQAPVVGKFDHLSVRKSVVIPQSRYQSIVSGDTNESRDKPKIPDHAGSNDAIAWFVRMGIGLDRQTLDAFAECHDVPEYGGEARSPYLMARAADIDAGQVATEDSGNDNNQIFEVFPDASHRV